MDTRKSQFMGMIRASIVIVLISAVATMVLVTWSPIFPEANAVEMDNAKDKKISEFLPYIAFHQTVSWRAVAALDEFVVTVNCSK